MNTSWREGQLSADEQAVPHSSLGVAIHTSSPENGAPPSYQVLTTRLSRGTDMHRVCHWKTDCRQVTV